LSKLCTLSHIKNKPGTVFIFALTGKVLLQPGDTERRTDLS